MESTQEKPPVSAKPELFEAVFETKPVTVTREHVDLYAAATNDESGAYADGATPPLFGVRYHIALATQLISDPGLTVDLMRLVHGEQEMHFHAPLRVGDVLKPTLQLTGIEHKESGSLMRLRYCLHRGDELANECFTTYFVRRKGGKKTKKPAADGIASPTFTSSVTVRPDQSRHYAEASQDVNPIHVSDEMAQMCGFPGVILHGLCSLAFACRAVVENACDGDPERLESLRARFSKPVLMGDVLTTRGLVSDAGVTFDTVNQDGTPIITQGKAALRA
jgi:(3R)-3-hydroxyacyl-CoA dehydrogenase / 3a,7a,12a-trihydroxy-5b-cholest-24-enoyl-CoA hydratase / enoyl-CoA hydratase 2